MNKKFIGAIFAAVCTVSILTVPASAYYLYQTQPSVWHLGWFVNDICTTAETNAAIAAKDTWNGTVGDLSLDRYSYYSSGSIVSGDGVSEVAFVTEDIWNDFNLSEQMLLVLQLEVQVLIILNLTYWQTEY